MGAVRIAIVALVLGLFGSQLPLFAQELKGASADLEPTGAGLWKQACDHLAVILAKDDAARKVKPTEEQIKKSQETCLAVMKLDLSVAVADRVARCMVKAEDFETIRTCDFLIPEEEVQRSLKRQQADLVFPPKKFKRVPQEWFRACEKTVALYVNAVWNQGEKVSAWAVKQYRAECIEVLVNQSDTDAMTQCLQKVSDEKSFRACDKLITHRRLKPIDVESIGKKYTAWRRDHVPRAWSASCQSTLELVAAEAKKTGEEFSEGPRASLYDDCLGQLEQVPTEVATRLAACMLGAKTLSELKPCEKILEPPTPKD